jgi:hypothetical protein
MKRKVRQKKQKSLQDLAELAMIQAARKVREENKRFGEPLIVMENGRLKKIPPGEY